jgi:glycerate dehydrogenase
VTNVPAYSTQSVAQMVLAYLCHDACAVDRNLAAAANWPAAPDFCLLTQPMRELAGKTMTLVGKGAIGSAVGGIATALGVSSFIISTSLYIANSSTTNAPC